MAESGVAKVTVGTSRESRGSSPVALWPFMSLSALLAILFLTFLDNTVVSAVLTNVQSELHAGVSQLQWVVGAYALTFASLMLMAGSLGDNFGRKRIILAGVVVFCVGSVVCAISTSASELIIGRVVMGVGAAGSEPGTLSMIRHVYPRRRARARALGAWAAVSGLALAMGPVLGGVLVGLWSWRSIFWFNLVFGALAFVVALVALPESVNPVRRRMDGLGFVLGALTLGTATFATIAGESAGYAAGGIVSLYVVSVLAGALFVVHERRTTSPMLNLRFFRKRPFVGSTIVAYTSYFSIFSIFFFVALYLEVVASVSAYGLAEDFLPLLGGMVVSSLFAGRWVGRVGSRVPLMVGCAVAAVGVILTDLVISPHVGISSLGWTMGIAGVGFGITAVPVNFTALTSLPGEDSGMAASTTNTARELGAVTGVAILGSVVNGQLTVNLMARLAAIGIPVSYRSEVVAAITTGTVNQRLAGLGAVTSAAVQAIINKVVGAAYGAFTDGLHLALETSAILLILSAVLAYATGTRERTAPDVDDGD